MANYSVSSRVRPHSHKSFQSSRHKPLTNSRPPAKKLTSEKLRPNYTPYRPFKTMKPPRYIVTSKSGLGAQLFRRCQLTQSERNRAYRLWIVELQEIAVQIRSLYLSRRRGEKGEERGGTWGAGRTWLRTGTYQNLLNLSTTILAYSVRHIHTFLA
jgi:hypothetical protein